MSAAGPVGFLPVKKIFQDSIHGVGGRTSRVLEVSELGNEFSEVLLDPCDGVGGKKDWFRKRPVLGNVRR